MMKRATWCLAAAVLLLGGCKRAADEAAMVSADLGIEDVERAAEFYLLMIGTESSWAMNLTDVELEVARARTPGEALLLEDALDQARSARDDSRERARSARDALQSRIEEVPEAAGRGYLEKTDAHRRWLADLRSTWYQAIHALERARGEAYDGFLETSNDARRQLSEQSVGVELSEVMEKY